MARNFGVSYGPSENPLQRLKQGIARVESGGNYQALGPEIQRKAGTDRAYGKYQVMGANIPSWTEQALGRRLSPMEFLRSPEAQEAVFEHQMANNLRKYGTLEDAASVWFSGRPLAQAQKAGARDVNMGVGQYVNAALRSQTSSKGEQVAGGDEELFRRLQERASQRIAPKQTVASPEEVEAFRQLHERANQRLAPVAAPTPLPPVPAHTPVSPQVENVWGPGQEYLNSLTFGASRAALPYSSEQVAQMRKEYETAHPYESAAAEIAGGITQGAALAFGGPPLAAAALGSRAMQAIPAVRAAMPYLQKAMTMRPGYAGPFGSGGYIAKPGMGETAKRVLGGAGIGAAKGAGQAALNVGVHPEVPAQEQIGLGATVGGMAEPVSRYLTGVGGPTMAPHMEPNMRDIGLRAQQKFGINIMPWQLSNMPAEEAIASRLLTPEKAIEQAKQFGDAFGKLFGHTGDFTPKNVQTSVRAVGNEMENIASKTRIDLTAAGAGRQLRRDINDLAQEILTDVADPAEQSKLLKTLQIMDTDLFQKPLRGEVIQNLTQKDGMLDKNISPKTNSLYQYYNGRMKDIIYNTFHRADPATAADWEGAKQKYKAALIALKGSTDSGILDPMAVAKQASKVRGAGNIAELAEIGRNMFGVSSKGKPALPPQARPEGYFSNPLVWIGGAGAIPYAAGSLTEAGQAALSGIGFSPLAAAGGAALLSGLLYGGKKGFESAQERMLSTPYFSRSIMTGQTPLPLNVLQTPVGVLGSVTAAETRKARKKK